MEHGASGHHDHGKHIAHEERDDTQSYSCPMHPQMHAAQPGLCPECGMRLIPERKRQRTPSATSTHAEHDKHAGHSVGMFVRKFWLSLLLTVPVVLTSDVAESVHLALPQFPGRNLLPLLFGSLVFFLGGWVFLVGAWREVRARLPGMMTLIGIAVLTAYAYSLAVTVIGRGEPLYWELTTLITVMLLGHWLEMKAVQGAQGALRALSKLLPDTAEVFRGERTQAVPVRDVRVGDLVLVRPGGRVPADGTVTEGASAVNEALVTGESKPVPKRPGEEVIAGTTSGDGALTVRVTSVGEQTFLAGIMRLVAEAQASKSRLQLLSDRAALFLTVVALSASAVTFVSWFLIARVGIATTMERVVAVLVIACPHALGLAVPLVASISTTLAARQGFLVRQRLALERARRVTVVLFDKTGTLTRGEYGIDEVLPAPGVSDELVLCAAASVDARSEHAAARALVAAAHACGLSLLPVEDFRVLPGRGAEGMVDAQRVSVTGFSAEQREATMLPSALAEKVAAKQREGKTLVRVVRGEEFLGIIALADVIREESRAAVRALRGMNIRVAMVTGDAEDVAQWVGRELGMEEVFARVLPGDKAAKVRMLQERGDSVAFVGDGINDAPALAQADVGIAIGAGTNVAIESAGILLVRNDPRDVAKIIQLSQATFAKMIQNLFWAAGYNVVALPLAAGVLASRGVLLQPAVSALFMSLSTVVVAINALALRRVRLTTE